ncbi:MAG: sigma-70 family RNA polymerase sigma factor [Planctomycetota bacterium]
MSLTPEHILEHGPFLRGLARSLLRDAARADDVVQEAWLAALRRPREVRDLRPWLTGVVKNLVRRDKRAFVRREKREKRGGERSLSSSRMPEEILEQEEARRRLVDALLSLEEPYRTPLLLRFYDELPPREIAKRLRVPGSTVRTRIQRGLEQLRRKLDADHGGDTRAWSLALLPLAFAPRAVPASTIAALLGAASMKAKLTVVAALVAAGLLFFQQGRADTPQRVESPDTETAVLPVADPETETEETAPAVKTTTTESPGVYRVRGVFHWRGRAEATVRVRVRARDAVGVSHVEPIESAVAVGQEFDIVVDPLFENRMPATLEVEYEHPDAQSGTLKLPVRIDPVSKTPGFERVDVTLRPITVVRGRVRNPAAAPLAGATLAAFPLHDGTPENTSVARVLSTADGDFELRVPGSGPHLVVAVAHGHRPASRVIDVDAQEPPRMPPFDLVAGQAVGGRVTLTGARPAAEATVSVELHREGLPLSIPGSPHELLFLDGRVEHQLVFALADTEGHFRVAGLLAADYNVVVSGLSAAHHGLTHGVGAPVYARRVRAPMQGVDFEVAVATLVVSVRHDGEPLENAKVTVTQHRRDSSGASKYSGWKKTDAGGRHELLVTPGLDLIVKVEFDGLQQQTRKLRAPVAGRRHELGIDLRRLPRGELRVLLEPVGEEPPPLPPVWRFSLKPAADPNADATHRTTTIHEGVYRIPNLEPGRYTLSGYSGEYDVRRRGHYFPVSAEVTVTAGVPTRVTLRPRPGGRLSVLYTTAQKRTDIPAFCWVETQAGKRIEQRWFKYDDSSNTMWQSSLPDMRGPAFAQDVLEPGTYRVHLKPYADGAAEMTREVEIEAGKTAHVEFGG